MTPPGSPDERSAGSDGRPVVLILRLVLDRQAMLRHGELLDAEANGQGRFASVQGLKDAVDRWFERQRSAPKENERWNAI